MDALQWTEKYAEIYEITSVTFLRPVILQYSWC